MWREQEGVDFSCKTVYIDFAGLSDSLIGGTKPETVLLDLSVELWDRIGKGA
jgi:hypothetical protein